MKGDNEKKNKIVHRLINSMVKPSRDNQKVRSKSPVHKFKYELPRSFFEAVDEARVEAGYDVLPHFHRLSVSPSSHRQTPSLSSSTHRSKSGHHREKGHEHVRSSPTSDNDNTSSKKVRFRRTTHKHSHHHRQKNLAASSSARSSSRTKTSKTSHHASNRT